MPGFILGEKSISLQTFDESGARIPVTFIKTTPCYLIGIKNPGMHRYSAVKLGFGQTKNIKKTAQGELTKAGVKTPLRFFKEFRLEKFADNLKIIEEDKKSGIQIAGTKIFVGDEVKSSLFFKKGDIVDVSGTSKGKGFQGVVKRHHFQGGPKTHGQSDRERAPGSIGMTTTPGRVFKGKRMAGRMGGDRVTVRNLMVVEIKEDGLVVKGLIPGAKGSLIEIKKIN
jgi:large subunit ribosomal protein L3